MLLLNKSERERKNRYYLYGNPKYDINELIYENRNSFRHKKETYEATKVKG